MTARSRDFNALVTAAVDQGFKVIELADGHVKFTSPRGTLLKTRRSGVEKATGRGYAWANMVRRLRRIGLKWPPPAPVPATVPSLIHAKARPMLIQPRPTPTAAEASIEQPTEEKSVATPQEVAVPRNYNIATKDELAEVARGLAEVIQPGTGNSIEFANMVGVSRALIDALRRGEGPAGGGVAATTLEEVHMCIERARTGDWRPTPLFRFTSKQRALLYRMDRNWRSIAELANLNSTHPEAVRHLLLPLESHGAVARDGRGRYRLSELGEALVSETMAIQEEARRKLSGGVTTDKEASAPTAGQGQPDQPEEQTPPSVEVDEQVPALPRLPESAGQVFADLFEQELNARLEPLRNRITELEAKNSELREMLSVAQQGLEQAEGSKKELYDAAMKAAEQAIRAAIDRRR